MRIVVAAATLALGLFLGACATGPDAPPQGTPYVEVYSGAQLYGMSVTRIYEGDVIFFAQSDVVAGTASERYIQGRPGLWQEVAALVAAEGPRVRPETVPEDYECMDYGMDSVEAVPPLGGFSKVWATCPDEGVQGLMQSVRDIIPPDPV